jgi:hypothetical protein
MTVSLFEKSGVGQPTRAINVSQQLCLHNKLLTVCFGDLVPPCDRDWCCWKVTIQIVSVLFIESGKKKRKVLPIPILSH